MKKRFLLSNVLLFIYFLSFSQSTTVYTCKGGAVAAFINTEYSQAQIEASNNKTMSQFGYLGITIIGNSSNLYNCHSYAWHLSEGNQNKVWINNASQQIGNCYDETHNIDKYWTDGCFIQVCDEADADKLHYYCGDHSAIKSTSNPGYFESKWGQLALVRHTKMGVPYADPVNSVNYYASTKISGSTSDLCTGNRTFSVKTISNAAYSWTYSNNLIPTTGTTSPQFTVQQNGNSTGSAWVQVQISTACSSIPATRKIYFNVGTPKASNITLWNSISSTSIGSPVGFVAGYPPDNRCQIQSTDWQVSLNTSFSTGNFPCDPDNGTSMNIFFQEAGTAYVQARIQNSCGWSDWSAPVPIEVSSGYFYMLAPNPTTNSVTVKAKNNSLKEITEIKIFDNTGYLKKQHKYVKGVQETQINISDFKNGLYFIEISNGQFKEKQQLIVQK